MVTTRDDQTLLKSEEPDSLEENQLVLWAEWRWRAIGTERTGVLRGSEQGGQEFLYVTQGPKEIKPQEVQETFDVVLRPKDFEPVVSCQILLIV